MLCVQQDISRLECAERNRVQRELEVQTVEAREQSDTTAHMEGVQEAFEGQIMQMNQEILGLQTAVMQYQQEKEQAIVKLDKFEAETGRLQALNQQINKDMLEAQQHILELQVQTTQQTEELAGLHTQNVMLESTTRQLSEEIVQTRTRSASQLVCLQSELLEAQEEFDAHSLEGEKSRRETLHTAQAEVLAAQSNMLQQQDRGKRLEMELARADLSTVNYLATTHDAVSISRR